MKPVSLWIIKPPFLCLYLEAPRTAEEQNRILEAIRQFRKGSWASFGLSLPDALNQQDCIPPALACTCSGTQNTPAWGQSHCTTLTCLLIQYHSVSLSSVQSLSHVRLFATPWTTARQASLSITNFWSLLKLMLIESVMPSSHLILCRPLLLLPPIPPSIRVFSNESILRMRWPKYWCFSFSISPSNEPPGLISFRMDWLDLPAVQGTLKSLLQHHSSKASIFQCSAFFTVFWVFWEQGLDLSVVNNILENNYNLLI